MQSKRHQHKLCAPDTLTLNVNNNEYSWILDNCLPVNNFGQTCDLHCQCTLINRIKIMIC